MMPFSPKPKQSLLPKPAALSNTHRISFAGQIFIPHMTGALYAPGLRTLLVADLHLEQGASLARRGIHLPPYDTLSTLQALRDAIAETSPARLILLGDSFHHADSVSLLDEDLREALQVLSARQETIWISGNHDPSPHGLGGQCTDELNLAGITLRHAPKLATRTAEISGHLHPGCTVVQRGVAVRGKCFVADESRMMLPAFGSYTGALDLTDRAFSGLFNRETAKTWLIGRAAIHHYRLKDLV